jgi:sarcosine oxidase subunit gamma
MLELSAARRPAALVDSAPLRPLAPATRYILRGAEGVMTAAGKELALTLAAAPCRASLGGSYAALWLGPDERLLLAAASDTTLGVRLERCLRELPHSLVDVSHRQTAFEVSGPQTLTLLAAGIALDLAAHAFPVGMCTRTMLAKSEIVLWRTAEQCFRIEVWRSFAAYVSRFLAEAARGLEPA